MKRKFNLQLHSLRGIAAVLVFLGHITGGFSEHVFPLADPRWIARFVSFGTYGVEIFFFLSGYVIYTAARGTPAGRFASHRFWRIYPVYVLFTILFFVGNSIVHIEPEKNHVAYLVLNLLFLDLFTGTPSLTPNAWTITYEIWFYVATYLVVGQITGRFRALMRASGVLLSLFLIYISPVVLYYLAGALVAAWLGTEGTGKLRAVLLLNALQLVSLAAIFILASVEFNYGWRMPDLWRVGASIATLTVFMVTLIDDRSVLARTITGNWLMVLGTVSYTLYLAHPYSYLTARTVITRIYAATGSPALTLAVFVPLVLALTFLLVRYVHRYVENGMYRRFTGKEILVPVRTITAPPNV